MFQLKNKIAVILLATVVVAMVSSCGFFMQSGELKRFAECEFSVVSAQFVEIGGVDVSKVQSLSELGMANMLSIGQQAMTGKLPARLNLIVNANNSSEKKASISGMDYKVFIKDQELANGSIDEKVSIEAKSGSTFPVSMNVDLISLMNSSSIDQLLKIALGNESQKKISEMGISVQLRPYYLSGSELKKYPGTITIKP